MSIHKKHKNFYDISQKWYKLVKAHKHRLNIVDVMQDEIKFRQNFEHQAEQENR